MARNRRLRVRDPAPMRPPHVSAGSAASLCTRARTSVRSAASSSDKIRPWRHPPLECRRRRDSMSFPHAGKVWMNGTLVDWNDAKIHIASHVIHYGSGVFEGARCYSTPKGPACFRIEDHMRRLFDSARIYRMQYELDQETLTNAVIDTIRANKFDACYIRPVIYRGY